MNALQIKHINYFENFGEQWSDEINPEDPSVRDLLAKMKQQKKLITFIDKVAEKNRQRRAKHKGGFVPVKKRKINVDFYPSSGSDFDNDDPLGENKKLFDEGNGAGEEGKEGEPKKDEQIGKQLGTDGKRTIEMFDLMLPRGTSLKAYSRQEEDRRKVVAKMKKQGLDFDDPLNLNNKNLPNEPLKMPRIENLNMSSDESQGEDGNISDEVLKEFKLMTEKDQALAKARIENQELEKKLRIEEREEKARRRKKELKRKKKMRKEAKKKKYGSSSSDEESKDKKEKEEKEKEAELSKKLLKTRRQINKEIAQYDVNAAPLPIELTPVQLIDIKETKVERKERKK